MIFWYCFFLPYSMRLPISRPSTKASCSCSSGAAIKLSYQRISIALSNIVLVVFCIARIEAVMFNFRPPPIAFAPTYLPSASIIHCYLNSAPESCSLFLTLCYLIPHSLALRTMTSACNNPFDSTHTRK